MRLRKVITAVAASAIALVGFAGFAAPAHAVSTPTTSAFNPPTTGVVGTPVELYAVNTFDPALYPQGTESTLSVGGVLVEVFDAVSSPTDIVFNWTPLAAGDFTLTSQVIDFAGVQPTVTETRSIDITEPLPPVVNPTVTGLSRVTGSTAGGVTVVITGTGFAAGAAVTFGGTPAGTVVDSATQLTVTTPVHAAGAVDVAVTNLDGGTVTATAAYTYVTPVPPIVNPTVTTITPNHGSPLGGTLLTYTGTGFATGASVTFGGTDAALVTVDSATQLTVVAPSYWAGGFVNVVVTNLDGGTVTVTNGYRFASNSTATAAVPAVVYSGGEAVYTSTAATGQIMALFIDGHLVTSGPWGGTPYPVKWQDVTPLVPTVVMMRLYDTADVEYVIDGDTPYTGTATSTFMPYVAPIPTPPPTPTPTPDVSVVTPPVVTPPTPEPPVVTPPKTVVTVKWAYRDGHLVVVEGKTAGLLGRDPVFTVVTKDKAKVTLVMIREAKALAKKYQGVYGGVVVGDNWVNPRIVGAFYI